MLRNHLVGSVYIQPAVIVIVNDLFNWKTFLEKDCPL